jgi:5-methylcytosine-specific restriction endonuclease McrA
MTLSIGPSATRHIVAGSEKNHDHVHEYSAEWRSSNLEHHRDNARSWAKNNRVRINEKRRLWRLRNPDLQKAHRAAHEGRRKAAAGDSFSAQEILAQYRRQHGRCYWCSRPVGDIWDVDHVVALSRGGANHISNIVIACPTCNRSKQAKLPHEFSSRLC